MHDSDPRNNEKYDGNEEEQDCYIQWREASSTLFKFLGTFFKFFGFHLKMIAVAGLGRFWKDVDMQDALRLDMYTLSATSKRSKICVGLAPLAAIFPFTTTKEFLETNAYIVIVENREMWSTEEFANLEECCKKARRNIVVIQEAHTKSDTVFYVPYDKMSEQLPQILQMAHLFMTLSSIGLII